MGKLNGIRPHRGMLKDAADHISYVLDKLSGERAGGPDKELGRTKRQSKPDNYGKE